MTHAVRLSLVFTMAAALPLAAQGGGGMGGMRMGGGDPTNAVQGSGKLPDGWMLRFDPQRGGGAAPPMTAVKMEPMGTGFHFTSGPAAIYYRTADKATGEYAVTAKFSQRKSNAHEAMGIFIGGSNLQDDAESYLYFVFKPFDQNVNISRRNGATVTALLPRNTTDANVVKDDPTDGHATNEMTIHVAKDTVHFILNGKLIKALPKSQVGATDGTFGLRVNHNIDVHVDGFKKQ